MNTKAKISTLSKLERALLINLCYLNRDKYENIINADGWKTRKQIIETEKKFKDSRFKDLCYTSSYLCLPETKKKLLKKGLIELSEITHKKGKKIKRPIKRWRVKRSALAYMRIWNIWGDFELSRINEKEMFTNSLELFQKSDYYKMLPENKDKFRFHIKEATAKVRKNNKLRLLLEYKFHKQAAEYCKKRLSEVHNLNLDKKQKKPQRK